MLSILTILYGACAYPIVSLMISQNLFYLQYPFVRIQSASPVRSLIQFYHPTQLLPGLTSSSIEKNWKKSYPSLLQITKSTDYVTFPFEPTNSQGLYSAMMRNFKEGWYLLFTPTLRSIYTLGNNAVSVTETDVISIIDDILLFCISFDTILIQI